MDDLEAGQAAKPSALQRRLAVNRLIAIAFVTALLPLVWPMFTHPAVLVMALLLAWAIGLSELFGSAGGAPSSNRETAVSLADTLCLLGGIMASGGYDSPFYVAAYAALFSFSYGGDTRRATFTAGLYMATFFLLGASQHRIVGNLPEFSVRELFLALSAMIGVTLSREVAAQVAARAKAEEQLASESRFKAMEQQLMIADRLVSVGTMAAGVAHEINNPLSYVIGNLDYCAEVLAEPVERLDPARIVALRKALAEAALGADRVRAIVQDLKVFSRADSDEIGPVDVRAVADSAINMAHSVIRHRAKLTRHYGDVPPVRANAGRLGQVLLNLLVNAAQAIPEESDRDGAIQVVTEPAPGGRVAIEVRDTGVGIPGDRLHRVFEPFFTSKPPGTGTGLGLFVCHGIVSALGGEIAIESEVGLGTRVRVILPACDGEAPPVGLAAAPVPVASVKARILAVDDEPLVLGALSRILGAEFDVIGVGTARDALDLVRRDDRFDLLIVDVMMPDADGIDLHAAITELDAALAARILFLTGGAATERAKAFLEHCPNPCLQKPFRAEAVRAAVRSMSLERSTPDA